VADPVSWLVIEPGWKVRAVDGKELGKVEEVVGDTGNDIFSGLSVSHGLFSKPRYVPSEHVVAIYPGEVHVELSHERMQQLDEYEQPPPSEQILPPDRTH
jgi:uncharacterized protein YrrD